MAHIAHSGEGSGLGRFWAAIGSAFHAFGAALTVNASAEARLREVNRLQALTDQELSERGLSRDMIVRHVFRDIYDI